MSLRPLLAHFEDDTAAASLARDGGRAFTSSSLRPFALAALADRDARTPTIVVAGDDRQARDLAADLRAWLAPRAVRFYPSRGVAYESHLAPPPHLVGLRVAALDALLARPDPPAPSVEAPVVVVSAVALSEKVPDPELRPHSLSLRVGDLLDIEEFTQQLAAAGYERIDQVTDRGQFAVRGGILDIYPGHRGPRRPRRPVRHRDRVAALVLDLHAALAGRRRVRRDRAGGRAGARAPRAGRDRRAVVRGRAPGHRRAAAGRSLPRVPGPRAGRRAHPDRRRGGDRARRWPTTGRTCAPPSTTRTRAICTCAPTTSRTRWPRAPTSSSARSPATSRSSCAGRRPTPPPARSRRPSPSWRS